VPYLQFLERPELHKPSWIGSFVGWADAQEGASAAVRYLVRHLPATKFAEIDPEEFYDFTLVRPVSYSDSEGRRRVRWPTNEFYYWKSPNGDNDLLFFLGTEPNLKWKTYIKTIFEVVSAYDIPLMVNLGALLDALPHTRDPLLSGNVNKDELRSRIEGLRIRARSNYQGPAGITAVFGEAVNRADMNLINIRGHAPHYVQQSPNWKVVKALVGQVNRVFNLDVSLEDLEQKARSFESEVTRAVAGNIEASAYVKRLERQYDENVSPRPADGGELPSPKAVVEEVERFLRGGDTPSS
jgi:proteasome assembly chaperone (PAC2) family protein